VEEELAEGGAKRGWDAFEGDLTAVAPKVGRWAVGGRGRACACATGSGSPRPRVPPWNTQMEYVEIAHGTHSRDAHMGKAFWGACRGGSLARSGVWQN
jgi:hypothetical protein